MRKAGRVKMDKYNPLDGLQPGNWSVLPTLWYAPRVAPLGIANRTAGRSNGVSRHLPLLKKGSSMETSSPQSTSRRSFLKLGAAALAASAVGAPRLWAADAHAGHGDDYGGLKMGIQSYSLRDRSFEKTLEAMKNDLKLHYVEVYPAHFTGKSPRQNMDLLKSHDVTVLSYGVIPFSKDEKKNRE